MLDDGEGALEKAVSNALHNGNRRPANRILRRNDCCVLASIRLRHRRVRKPQDEVKQEKEKKRDIVKEIKHRLKNQQKMQAILHYFNSMTLCVFFFSVHL